VGPERVGAVVALNLALSAAAAAIVYGLGVTIFGARAGLFGGLLWATYPFNLWLVKQPNSEIPFLVLFVAAWLLLARALENKRVWGGIAAGLVMGGAALVRPAVLFLPALFAVLLLIRARGGAGRGRLGVLFLAAFLAAIAPWVIAASVGAGRFILMSDGGLPSVVDGATFGVRKNATPLRPDLDPEITALMARLRAREAALVSTPAVVRAFAGEARRDPRAFGKLAALKAARAWYGTQAIRHERIILAVQLAYLVLGAAGLAWAAFRRRAPGRQLGVLVAIIGYFYVVTIMVVPLLRYMIPAMVGVILGGGAAVDALAGVLKRRPAAATS
jgi:4-amino-4-deoxy-L-arabinose transferase-like glycosyltransferase